MDKNDGNKKEKLNVVLPRLAYNQLIKLVHDKDFVSLLEDLRQELEKLPNKISTPKFKVSASQKIKKYLHQKNVPFSWLEPIYNMTVGKFPIDIPVDNSISLRVCNQEVTGSTRDIFLIRDKNGLLVEDPTISIVITSKVSAEHIIQFVKDHKKEIEQWQESLQLPDYKKPNWKDISLALKIIEMKDEQNLTFSQITENLQVEANENGNSEGFTFDENTIKTIYSRYKKRLAS